MSFSLQEAALQEPMFAHLRKLGAESSRNLALALQKLPQSLHQSVKAGPIENAPLGQTGDSHHTKVWCIIATNNAAASKIRQLLPLLLTHLQGQGTGVASLRLAVEKKS